MMRPEDRAREMLAESGIPEAGSTMLLERLTSLGRSVDEVELLPGPELASLMARTAHGAAGSSRRRRGRLMVATAVAVGTVGAGGLAAAANELPDGAQDLVAKFSERYLPFDLPRAETPGTDPGARFAPAPQTPPPSQGAERTGDPAMSPAGEAPEAGGAEGRARDEGAPQRPSEPSPRSPSLTDPGQTRLNPAPAPAGGTPLPGEDGGQGDEPGGAEGPATGEVPATEPQGDDAGVAEKPPPETAPGADAGPGPGTLPAEAAERSKGGERRGPGVRGKPSAAPADGGDG